MPPGTAPRARAGPAAAASQRECLARALARHLPDIPAGVPGCGFKPEVRGSEVIRMTPWKDGKANEGHPCVKGRSAWGFATHKDRITKPMIRAKITDPGRGERQDDWVGITSRAGETVLRADITERVQPGVVCTIFHVPESGR